MRVLRIAVPGLLLVAALAACGGKPADEPGVATAGDGANPSPTVSVDDKDRKRQFMDCMRAEGVDMDDLPDSGDAAVRTEKGEMATAMEKCRHFMPDGGELAKASPEDVEKLRQYARCMRENGQPEFPDPDPDTGSFKPAPGSTERPRIDNGSDAFKRAHETCQDQLPQARKGGR